MSVNDALFTGFQAGALALSHRIVLAPLTRVRATKEGLAPDSLTAEYYAQRASAGGLLITEAVHISVEGTPVWTIYPAVREHGGHVPGIWTEEQTDAWRAVTKAVHDKGGLICCQLLHAGRVAQTEISKHPLARYEKNLPPVAPSAVKIKAAAEAGDHYSWDQPVKTPRALETKEITRVVTDYEKAAQNAQRAGFNCVELHAAHGYLQNQFLCDGVNRRTDCYGGSVENRCRLLYETVAALIGVMGEGRVGVRLSPTTSDAAAHVYFDANDSEPEKLYAQAVQGLNAFPLAYLLLTETRCGGLSKAATKDDGFNQPLNNTRYRNFYKGVMAAAGGFTPCTAAAAIANGDYDLIAFGRWFISNPDLVARIRHGSALNIYERATFYGGGEKGYTDYPDESAKIGRANNYEKIPQADIGVSLRRPQQTGENHEN